MARFAEDTATILGVEVRDVPTCASGSFIAGFLPSPAAVTRYLPVRLTYRNGTWWACAHDVEAEHADALAVILAHHEADASLPIELILLR